MENVVEDIDFKQKRTIKGILIDSLINTHEMFLHSFGKTPFEIESIKEYKEKLKINDEYEHCLKSDATLANKYNDKLSFRNSIEDNKTNKDKEDIIIDSASGNNINNDYLTKTKLENFGIKRDEYDLAGDKKRQRQDTNAIITLDQAILEKNAMLEKIPEKYRVKGDEEKNQNLVVSLIKNQNHITFRKDKYVAPEWHAPWKLSKVLIGQHTGWVRCIDVDPTNQWFVTGSNDKMIKFWELSSGIVKVSLTGHINTVRGLAISKTMPYLFSCGEDKMIKCWDLEQNKVIRHYHGHLSGIYSLALHPTLDVLITGGRDCVGRVWDIRTKQQIDNLEGHNGTLCSIVAQEHDPQVITGSHDCTIRQWDLRKSKTPVILTHHKKSVRSLAIHHEEYTYISGAADNLKAWKCPEGRFLRNYSGHNSIVNSVAINKDNVLVSAADDGSIYFWDYKSGYNFQKITSQPQPGSLSCEAGVFAVKFDQSSTLMITAECDKSVKIWRENETATKENFPINFN